MKDDKRYSLVLGKNKKEEIIEIPLKRRLENLLVIGDKCSGKSNLVLKEFARQSIDNKKAGSTFIVTSKDLSYEIYMMAKNSRRRILFINPSVLEDAEILLDDASILSKFNYDKYIYNNYIVIIDMENQIHKEKSIKAVSNILKLIESSIYKEDKTNSNYHFLFIDDAQYYLSNIEDVLYYGNKYNIGTTLFVQNREQLMFNSVVNASYIDSNINSTILTNLISNSDYDFYKNTYSIEINNARNYGSLILLSKDNVGSYEEVNLEFDLLEQEKIDAKLKSLKKSLIKKKNKKIKVSNPDNCNLNKEQDIINIKNDDIKEVEEIKVVEKIESEDIKDIEYIKDIEEVKDVDLSQVTQIANTNDVMNNQEQTNVELNISNEYVKIDNPIIFSEFVPDKVELNMEWDFDDDDF